MIIDTLENSGIYFKNKAWQTAFDFIKAQNPASEEKKYHLMGDDLYATVMSYQTKPRAGAILEAHRKYIDVQVMIAGSETIEYSNIGALEIQTQYSTDKDAVFYVPPDICTGSNLLIPGVFQVFFPGDAHMPGLNSDTVSAAIKKIVVKINADLLL